jgi:hypothetical protein
MTKLAFKSSVDTKEDITPNLTSLQNIFTVRLRAATSEAWLGNELEAVTEEGMYVTQSRNVSFLIPTLYSQPRVWSKKYRAIVECLSRTE